MDKQEDAKAVKDITTRGSLVERAFLTRVFNLEKGLKLLSREHRWTASLVCINSLALAYVTKKQCEVNSELRSGIHQPTEKAQ